MKRVDITYSLTPPVTSFFTPLSLESANFRNMYFGGKGLKYNTSAELVPFDPVGQLTDVIGTAHMLRRGTLVGALSNSLTPSAPMSIKNRFLVFENEPDRYFDSNVFTGIQVPFEIHMVHADQPGQAYEGNYPGGDNRGYLGRKQYTSRIINSGYGDIDPADIPPFYKLQYLRVRVNANGTATYWRNNVQKMILNLQGGDLSQVLGGTFLKTYNGVGVNTNSTDFWFAQMGVVDHALSDSAATALYNAIAARWSGDGYVLDTTFVNQALLSTNGDVANYFELSWNWSGGTITPVYTSQNYSGKTLSPQDEWQWEWRYRNDQTGFATQELVATTRVIADTVYPNNTGGRTGGVIKWRARVKFTDNTYADTFISGVYKDIQSGTGHA